jgi:hypothetical protein
MICTPINPASLKTSAKTPVTAETKLSSYGCRMVAQEYAYQRVEHFGDNAEPRYSGTNHSTISDFKGAGSSKKSIRLIGKEPATESCSLIIRFLISKTMDLEIWLLDALKKGLVRSDKYCT